VDSQRNMGGSHPLSGGRARRADFEVQVHHQRKASVGMVLARSVKRGGMECTILVHIHTRAKGVSVQKRKHLHWKALEQTLNLDNEVAFAAPAHNLLMRSGEEDSTRQALKNRWASLRASPQAVRKKKRFTKLDMTILMNPETNSPDPAQGELLEDWQIGKFAAGTTTKPSRSINPPVAGNKLTYV